MVGVAGATSLPLSSQENGSGWRHTTVGKSGVYQPARIHSGVALAPGARVRLGAGDRIRFVSDGFGNPGLSTDELRSGVSWWRQGAINTGQLRDLVGAWRSGGELIAEIEVT